MYSSPTQAALGLAYQLDSRLLVVNPPEAILERYGTAVPTWPWSEYYVWGDGQFKLVFSAEKKQ